jgi:deoxyribonuclease-4
MVVPKTATRVAPTSAPEDPRTQLGAEEPHGLTGGGGEHAAEPPRPGELVYDAGDEYRPEPAPPAMAPFWKDGSVRIGIHTSIAGDITQALEIASKLGCNALQIFSSSPRMWPRTGAARIAAPEAARFRARRAELGLGPLVIHDNYLINLASPDPMMRVRSIQAFREELLRAAALGADFLVAHPGSGRGSGVVQAIEAIADGFRQASRGMRFGDLRILVENTSGMGSAVGSRFEELAAILAGTPDLPMGVCVDTAHLFEAGFDIRTEAGLEASLERIERTVGLSSVYVLHVNDSKTPLGSRVDRHEHIGKGKIGLEAFRRILNHGMLSAGGAHGVPGRAFILETPIDAPGDDRRNVRTLWKLVGLTAKQAPKAEDGFTMYRGARSVAAAARKLEREEGKRSTRVRTRKPGHAKARAKGKKRGQGKRKR